MKTWRLKTKEEKETKSFLVKFHSKLTKNDESKLRQNNKQASI